VEVQTLKRIDCSGTREGMALKAFLAAPYKNDWEKLKAWHRAYGDIEMTDENVKKATDWEIKQKTQGPDFKLNLKQLCLTADEPTDDEWEGESDDAKSEDPDFVPKAYRHIFPTLPEYISFLQQKHAKKAFDVKSEKLELKPETKKNSLK
jgi:hypothetical protein